MLYTAYTDADVALTAATAKTSLLVIPPSGFGYNLCVVEVGAEFEGAVQATDCLVELVESTQATAGTSGSAAAAKQLRGSRAISPTAAVTSTGLGLAINKGYTAEPTVLSPLYTPFKMPNGQSMVWQFPLDTGPEFPAPGGATGALGLRLTSPIGVNARCHITFAVGWR
jgi:hypothetical protein